MKQYTRGEMDIIIKKGRGSYITKKPLKKNGKTHKAHSKIELTGREAEVAYYTGHIDDKGGKYHSLDKRFNKKYHKR